MTRNPRTRATRTSAAAASPPLGNPVPPRAATTTTAAATPAPPASPPANPPASAPVTWPGRGTATGPEWHGLSARLTALAPEFTGRDDVTVTIEPAGGTGVPGWTLPDQAQIWIDGTWLAVPPATAQPGRVRDRSRYRVLMGIFTHECAHARHSLWIVPLARHLRTHGHLPVNEAYLAAAHLLEESRAERRHLTRRRRDRRWLRAAVKEIVTHDLDDADTPWAAAVTAALVLARADAFVLTRRETAPLRKRLDQALGRKRVTRLRRVWLDAHALDDDDTDQMLACGRRWCELLDTDPAGPTPTRLPIPASGSPRTAVNRAAITAAGATSPPPPHVPPAADDARAGDSPANTVFGDATAMGVTPGRADWRRRRPTASERSASHRLAAGLRIAGRRLPVRVRTRSASPGGRLRVSQAAVAEAQRRAGAVPTAQPWEQARNQRRPQPQLRVGIAADISSSMSGFIQPLSSAAWIIADATASVGGLSATVTFGQHVTPVTDPRHHPGNRSGNRAGNHGGGMVREFVVELATDGAPLAVAALTEILELATQGPGARILALVTDGKLPRADRTAVEEQIRDLTASGCLVLTIAPERRSTALAGAQHLTVDDPANAPALITAAMRSVLATWRPRQSGQP